MMKKMLLTTLGLAALAIPALAHHSAAAEYNLNKPVTLSGTVSKVEWLNPHVRFYLDVKAENGTVTPWEFETGSPNQLMRQGWRQNTLKVGDQITVDAYPAKDGTNLGDAQRITSADGRKLLSGSGDGAPAIEKEGAAKK